MQRLYGNGATERQYGHDFTEAVTETDSDERKRNAGNRALVGLRRQLTGWPRLAAAYGCGSWRTENEELWRKSFRQISAFYLPLLCC